MTAEMSALLLDRRESLQTQGEIEAAVADGLRKFEQENMGRGPKDWFTPTCSADLLVVPPPQGVLTAAEEKLAKSIPVENGRALLKDVRRHLIETARPILETIIRRATGVPVVSLHYDVSTVTGNEVVIFSLARPPLFRQKTR